MTQTIVEPGQTTFDVVLQQYGSMEGLFDFVSANGLSAITQEVSAGTIVRAGDAVDKNMKSIIKGLNIVPATGMNEAQAANLTPEGIGAWRIAIEFIVS